MRIRNVLIAAAVACTAVAVFTQPRAGNWQITMEMAMEGMPQGMPPMTVTQCLTQEQVDDPQKMMPQGPGRGNAQSDCKVSDYKMVDNKATWQMACGGQNPMTGSGEITYTADTYAGAMKMNVSRGGKAQTMTMKYNGKRLGECAK